MLFPEYEENQHNNFYFYLIDVVKYRKVKGRHAFQYPNIPSFIAPVLHGHNLPIPQAPAHAENNSIDFLSEQSKNSGNREIYQAFGLMAKSKCNIAG